MAEEFTTVLGLKELNAALQLLPERIARNVLRGAVNAGATVFRQEAVQRAPVYTGEVSQGHPPPGTLKRSIYQKQIQSLSSLIAQTYFVGVRIGKHKTDRKGRSLDAFYWRFVEFGTSKMAARPFMRPAFDAAKLRAIEAVRDYLVKRIPREAEQLNTGPRR